jgi:hypothetical protein
MKLPQRDHTDMTDPAQSADPLHGARHNARLDTVRAYTRPTADDRIKALDLLPTDR